MSSKDAYYFSHDANARNDVKSLKLRREMGLEGYGLFWCLIEMLREEENHMLPLNLVEDIAFNLHTSKEKVEAVITRYGLFQIENDEFFSARLLRSMESYKALKNKQIENGRKGGISKALAGLKQGSSDPLALKESKGKEIKENESKENETIDSGADAPSLKELMEGRKVKFRETLTDYIPTYGEDTINQFFEYWTEPNKSHTKYRQEMEKTWDLKRRISTWITREYKYNTNDTSSRGTKKTTMEVYQDRIREYSEKYGDTEPIGD